MIALENHARGVVLPVKAELGARQNAIRGEQNGMLKVSVTQAPEKGKAHQAIVEVLAKSLALQAQPDRTPERRNGCAEKALDSRLLADHPGRADRCTVIQGDAVAEPGEWLPRTNSRARP